MTDKASGSAAGYLFQFEKALLLLTNLDNKTDYVSIESVDDIAKHKENGTVLITIQAKHSISNSGTTFEDTSYSLWRTLQIWIHKIELKIFNDKTEFICSSNKTIPDTSLLSQIISKPFDEVIQMIKDLLQKQKDKLKKTSSKGKSAKTIKQTISLMEDVLAKQSAFKVVKNNLKVEVDKDIKEKFFTKLNLVSSKVTDLQREAVFESFYGWLTSSCRAKWNNGTEARFSKENFAEKWFYINTNPSIMNAIFRTKESLGTVSDSDIAKTRKELFVRQIEEIKRNKEAQERIIRNAILDFIYSDIEIFYIVDKGNFTEDDFNTFLDECTKTWQNCFDQHVVKELSEYSDSEKNDLAIKIYDAIMNKIEIKFKDHFAFTNTNSYIRNGSFLKLSNEPRIGWHPDWKTKYIK